MPPAADKNGENDFRRPKVPVMTWRCKVQAQMSAMRMSQKIKMARAAKGLAKGRVETSTIQQEEPAQHGGVACR